MGRFYGLKIRNGVLTLEQVRDYWRPMVEKWLAENE